MPEPETPPSSPTRSGAIDHAPGSTPIHAEAQAVERHLAPPAGTLPYAQQSSASPPISRGPTAPFSSLVGPGVAAIGTRWPRPAPSGLALPAALQPLAARFGEAAPPLRACIFPSRHGPLAYANWIRQPPEV
jgi:hypothetical protein